ncbi:FHA domain-containing protein FHA2-like [Triticum aestivum]|uniref:FHA domain-containing protein FHA2-like n=1 Tax=Triticum aestivum TaxID=4565 RepID=UPI001D01A062|nr:FHA domain-containing protein FHA2-like [Triticum aestivum]
MSGMNAGMGSARGDQLEAGFAKLQGEDFQYIMQSYEIIVGRNSKKGKVDFDLSAVGGDRDVSRRHARIFYDFQHRSFALEVLGQHGCYVQRVLHRPGDDPVKLKSQDLIQIGQTQFYFLLPARPIFASFAAEGTPHSFNFRGQTIHIDSAATASPWQTHIPSQPMSSSGKRPAHSDFSASRHNGYGGANCGNGINVGTGTQGLFTVPIKMSSAELKTGPINVERAKILETRIAHKDEDKKLEYHLASCVAIMLTGKFTAIWPYGNAQKYLAAEDGSSTRTAERPWHRLLELLKNHPERFIMSSVSRGTITLEFVSLVSLADKFCSPEVDQVTARHR